MQALIAVNAQSGPAGVGNSSSNPLWLRSHDISGLSDGDRISVWSDFSGNSNSLSQGNSLYQPEYASSVQNGFPTVRFNQVNNRLIKNSFSSFPTSAITVFMVNKNDNQDEDALLSYASSASANDFLIFDSDALRLYRNSNVLSSVSTNDNSWHIIDASWKSVGGTVEIWKDNASSYTSTLASGTSITAGGCLAIGAEQDAIDGNYEEIQTHNGDYLEIIIFNTSLNSAQRIIVGNYLAAKYNLSISNDFFSYQSTHSHELAGIGYFNSTNIHSEAQSAKLLTIKNASAMTTNGEYLLFGHNDASVASWTTTEAPPVNTQRIAREWRLDETGDVGNVDFEIDQTNLPSLPSGYTQYAVMVDADGDFSSGALVYELSLSGGKYSKSGISISDGDYVSIAAVKPTVNFSTITGSDIESVNASAEVALNYIPSTAVSVKYSTANVTATAGSDYTAAVASTLNFTAGNRTNTITVSVTDDAVIETLETFSITISSPSAGLNIGADNVFTHSIEDNDNTRKVYFDAASASGSESVTSVNIPLTINVADGSNVTTVNYTVTSGSATNGGVDYTLAAGTATFAIGTTTTNITFTVNDDAMDENNETFTVKLSSPVNCNLSQSNPVQFTYTIFDNDNPPIVQFTSTSSSASETVTSKTVSLQLSAVSAKNITLVFAATGTATAGVDYSMISSSPITILAGITTANISFTIVNDESEELDETVILSLSSPTNVSIGANNQHTYTIINDDVFGYIGPGGVGKSNNLKMWVRAEEIPGTTNGDDISAWNDQSGNANHLSQSNAIFKPNYYADQVNGFQIARFSAINSRLIRNSFTTFPTAEITSIYVNKTIDNGDGVFSYAVTSSDNEYLLYNSANLNVFRRTNSLATGTNASTGSWNIIGATWRNSNDAVQAFKNGSTPYTSTLVGDLITQGGCLAIGAEQDAVNNSYAEVQAHQGDFAEVILYNAVLNSAQRNIVNSYLSAKYNISLTASDKYAGDQTAKGDYDFEVIGIGRESDGFHLEAHGGGLHLAQNTNFDNGDYLLAGHSEVANRFVRKAEDADLPLGIEGRWARDYYFDITNTSTMISVNLVFDFSEAGINSSPAGAASNYRLLYRATNSGAWTNVTGASNRASDQVTFTGISLNNGDGYYALASIDTTASPLPVTWLSIDAERLSGGVVVKWLTASELNNEGFEIERSSDLKTWSYVGEVAGSGTVVMSTEYSFLDDNPLDIKTYYRIKQVDFDGKYDYSAVCIVDELVNNITLYPNPTSDYVYLQGIAFSSEIFLLDVAGRQVNVPMEKGEITCRLNMSSLSQGVYFIKIQSGNTVQVFKVNKEE